MAALTARTMLISVGGTDYTTQVFEAHVDADDADSDEITFSEAAAGGGRQYTLAFKLTQDLVASTLWDRIWTASGTDVAVLLKPYGNTVATVAQPHFSMTANIREPNGTFIGGEADAAPTKRLTTEVEWPLSAKPTRVTA
jgi:hypothetical protein